jgi:hypothetical protein
VRLHRQRDAEVQHLGLRGAVRLRDEDVRRLEIAVDHAPLVGVLDRPADLDEQRGLGAGAEALLPGVARQGRPIDELHDEEGLVGAVGVRGAGLVDLGDAGVLEPPEHLRLVEEAPQHPARRQRGPEGLDGDGPPGEGLLGLVHDPHAPLAHDAQQPVRPGEQGHPTGGGVAGTGVL